MTTQLTVFDYNATGLAPDDVETLKECAIHVKEHSNNAAQSLINVGQWLKEAQVTLNRRGKKGRSGGFELWVERETKYGLRVAYNLINTFEKFGKNDLHLGADHFSNKVIFALAAPSTPDEVIDEAIEKAEKGEKVTLAEVKRLKAAYKETQTELKATQSELELEKRAKQKDKPVDKEPERNESLKRELQELKSKLEAAQNEIVALKQQAKLQINPEFKDVLSPLTDDEFKQLEKNCLAGGIRERLVVWGDTLIDGHARYAIAQKHGLSYSTIQMDFADKYDAINWIINNQLGRGNLNEIQISYLKGLREIEIEKKDV